MGGGGGVGGAAGSEGTLASPVMLSASSSYAGTVSVNGPSYYEFTGLTGGATYSVTFSGISGSIIPMLFSSNTTSNGQSCFFSAVTGTASCIVLASPAGNIFIDVADFSTSSSTYTISAALAVDSGQGTPTAPVAIAPGSTYSGGLLTSGVSTTTYDTGNSGYYQLTGLTAYHRYTITLTPGVVNTAQLHAYQSSYSVEAATGCSGGTTCTITAAGTSLLLQVRATDAATFSIGATDLGAVTPYTAQGAVGTEMALQLDPVDALASLTTNGSVNTTKSYYTISRLVPGQRYYTHLNGSASLNDDVDLYVYRDSGYTQLACSSTNTGTTNENCMAVPSAAGQLWIVADGSKAQSQLGSSYFIGVKRAAPSQGTSASPQLVASGTDLPFRVNWTSGATSYYKITGLPANTAMMVTMSADHVWSGDYGNLTTYDPASNYGTSVCQTQNHGTFNPYQSCTGTTDASGNLYVSLDTGFFPNLPVGGTGYINVKAVPVNEGTSTAPLSKSMAPPSFTGQVATGASSYSYYALTGLTANTSYYILGTFGTDGQSGSVAVYNTFGTGDLTKETAVCSNSWSYLNNGCTAISDASGKLWVAVGGRSSDSGTNFKIEALAVLANQGTSGAPVNITGALPYRGKVAANGLSYYMVTGLTAASEYSFSSSDLADGDLIYVFNDSALTSHVCSTYALGGGRNLSCRGTLTGTTAYIEVSGSVAGGYYNLNLVQVPASEGSPAAPVAYTTSGTLFAGKVNVGTSYYKATLSPNTLYTISLNTVTGDPDIHVFNNSAMNGAEACGSIKGQTVAETCQTTSDANGNLWITVDGQLSKAGGTYQLKVN